MKLTKSFALDFPLFISKIHKILPSNLGKGREHITHVWKLVVMIEKSVSLLELLL